MCDIVYWELHKNGNVASLFSGSYKSLALAWAKNSLWGALRWRCGLSIGKVYDLFTVGQAQCIPQLNAIDLQVGPGIVCYTDNELVQSG